MMQPDKLIRIAVWWLSLFTATAASAGEVYKWKDADGRVHFGDKPVGTRAESVELRPSHSAPPGVGPELEAARRERTARLLNEYAVERSEREEARAIAQAATAKRRQRCTEARREQVELEHSSYLYTRDDNGNKQVLPDSEIRQERAKMAALTQALCKGDAGGH